MTSPIGATGSVSSYLVTPTGLADEATESATGVASSTASAPQYSAAQMAQTATMGADLAIVNSLSPAPAGADPLFGADSVTLGTADYTAAADYQMYTATGNTTALTQWLSTGATPTAPASG